MLDPSTIFQRTHSGREEIRQKSHGLTQSERLVLIMVDGVANYQEVRSKLPVLSDERYARAIANLQKKELIVEVFLPLEGQSAEELEKTVIDRFLQQDPLDPVTILVRDPEDEFGIPGYMPSAPVPIQAAPPSIAEPAAAVPETPVALDEMYIRLADSLAEEVKAIHAERAAAGMERPKTRIKPVIPEDEPVSKPANPAPAPAPTSPSSSGLSKWHWGYWLIAAGIAFIAGYFVARFTA
jgi:hypothetical protein